MSDTLPYAYGGPPLHATLRAQPEDFVVDELQDLVADGDGDHVWIQLRKRGANTDWVARELARYCEVKPVDVGYAGLKDRDAVTTQVFTVHLPGRPTPDWSGFPHDNIEILETVRHRRKLKRGALRGNRFTLLLRDVSGDVRNAEARLRAIVERGVPNYFGEQRFGLGGANVSRAEAMFAGKRVDRNTRSMLLSAVRSQLFNQVLAARVAADCWDRPLDGEIWSLAGSRSWFGPEPLDEALTHRLATFDIHPSGPLWGRGNLPSAGQARTMEENALRDDSRLREGLEKAGLEQDRRALRLRPSALEWQWPAPDVLKLSFELPPGCYATVILRELAFS